MDTPTEIGLTLKAEGQADTAVRGTISARDRKRMALFMRQYEELAACKPCRCGIPCNLSLKWEEGSELAVTTEIPDSDDLGVLLHRMRPFILKREPASFDAVSSLVGKSVVDDLVRRWLRIQRDLYEGRTSRSLLMVAFNERCLNSEQVLQDWLNSREYHRDLDKADAIDELFNGTPGDLAKAMMVGLLVDKVKAIRNLAALVRVLLTAGASIQFTLPGQAADTDQQAAAEVPVAVAKQGD